MRDKPTPVNERFVRIASGSQIKSATKTIIAGGVTFLLGAFVVPLLFILPLILEHQHEAQFKAEGLWAAIGNGQFK